MALTYYHRTTRFCLKFIPLSSAPSTEHGYNHSGSPMRLIDSKVRTTILPLVFAVVTASLFSGCASMNTPQNGQPLQQTKSKIISHPTTGTIEEDPVYQLLVAELAVNKGLTRLAIDNYIALAISQEDPEIAQRAVKIAIFGQDLDAAQIAVERWIDLEPNDPEAQQIIAAVFIRQDKPDLAYKYLDRMLHSHNNVSDKMFISLLTVLAREKNTDTVLIVSKRMADTYGEFAYANYLHGSLASGAERAEESLVYLDKALVIQNIPEAHTLRAKMLLKLGRRDEAVISLHKAVLSKPNNKSLRLAYARLLVDVKQYERARVEFEKLHLMAPNDTDLLYTLGLLSLESQRFDDAENYLQKLLKSGQRKGESQYYLGRIYESRNQFLQAIEWYEKVQTGEYRFDAQIRTATLIAKQGETDKALEYLKAMADKDHSKSSLVRIYLAEGEVLKRVKRYLDAVKVYDNALAIIPGNVDLLYARGLTAESAGNVAQLEKDMLAILKTEPDNVHALNALGFTLTDQTDRHEEAYQYIKKAIEMKPDDPAIMDSMGWVNYRMGNYSEAIRFLRNALTHYEDSEISAHLGEVLWVSGDKEEAVQVWKRALQKSPEAPHLIETMKRFKQY